MRPDRRFRPDFSPRLEDRIALSGASSGVAPAAQTFYLNGLAQGKGAITPPGAAGAPETLKFSGSGNLSGVGKLSIAGVLSVSRIGAPKDRSTTGTIVAKDRLGTFTLKVSGPADDLSPTFTTKVHLKFTVAGGTGGYAQAPAATGDIDLYLLRTSPHSERIVLGFKTA